MILCRTGTRVGVQDVHIKFTQSLSTYSIDDCNEKVKVTVIQQKQDWAGPEIKDSELLIPKYHTA